MRHINSNELNSVTGGNATNYVLTGILLATGLASSYELAQFGYRFGYSMGVDVASLKYNNNVYIKNNSTNKSDGAGV